MKMLLNRVTINALLKTVIAILGASVVSLLSLTAWDSWSRLESAGRAVAVADASTYLFTALHNLRFDRAVSRTELLADRQATTMNPVLRASRTAEMPALMSALAALERVNLPDRNAIIAALSEHIKRLSALHEDTAAAMQQPKAARRPHIAEDIFKEADDLIHFIDNLSTRLTLSTKLQDALTDQLMELKQLAWVVRNAAGDAAVMASYALEGRPQTAANLEEYAAKISKIRSVWAAFEDLAMGLTLPNNFAEAREKVNRDYFGSDYIDLGMKSLREAVAGQPPSLTVDQFTAMGKTSLVPLVAVAETTLEIARGHAVRQQASALQDLILQLCLLVAAVVLFVGAMSVVTLRVTRPLGKLTEAMGRLADGDFEMVLPGLERRDEIGAMANAVERFKSLVSEKARRETQEVVKRQQAEAELQTKAAAEQRRLSEAQAEAQRKHAEAQAELQAKAAAEQRQHAEAQARAADEQARIVRLLAEAMVKMSEGDLTHRLDEGFTESYRQIKEDFNTMAARLQETIGSITAATHEITNASAELSASTTDLSQRTEEQAASLEQTSASMEQMSATVRKNAENAQQANQSANNTKDVADRGGQVVAKAVGAMARIEESSGKISDIIGVIDEIARQTNLLALNAAVEAARAGEAGRGFAVVASEVRSLAQRSSQAAKDIKDLITNSNNQVKDGVDLVNKAGSALREIVDSIKDVVQIVSDIASASAEQATGLEEVNKALTQMDQATQQNSALVEENAATSKTLEHQAKVMDERIALFRTGQVAERKHEARKQQPLAAAASSRSAPATRKPSPAAPMRATGKYNGGGGPNGRLHASLTTASSDPEWKEF
jgi:methyl-accepting chemotaxis protein